MKNMHVTRLLSKQNVNRMSDPLSVPLVAGLRHMEEDLFHKVGSFMLDVYNDVQRGTLSAWSWPS